MLFKPGNIEKILRREKTQTRRLRKEGECGWVDYLTGRLVSVTDTAGRLKWEVGRTYAVCPGRGKPGVARIEILTIWQERVGSITQEDAIAEGFSGRDEFLEVFLRINPKADRNDWDWALVFELVEEVA